MSSDPRVSLRGRCDSILQVEELRLPQRSIFQGRTRARGITQVEREARGCEEREGSLVASPHRKATDLRALSVSGGQGHGVQGCQSQR